MTSAQVTGQVTRGCHRIDATMFVILCTHPASPLALMTASTSAVAASQPAASSSSSRATRASPWPAVRATPGGLQRAKCHALQSCPQLWDSELKPNHDRSADCTAAAVVPHCSRTLCNLDQKQEGPGPASSKAADCLYIEAPHPLEPLALRHLMQPASQPAVPHHRPGRRVCRPFYVSAQAACWQGPACWLAVRQQACWAACCPCQLLGCSDWWLAAVVAHCCRNALPRALHLHVWPEPAASCSGQEHSSGGML